MCPRKSYTVAEKLIHVKNLKTIYKNNLSEAARNSSIDRKQLRSWRDNEEDLANMDKKREVKRRKGGGRKPLFPEIEKQLYTWFVNERKINKNVGNYRRLREEAEKLAKNLNLSKEMFKISDKWLFSFSKRHKIAMRKVTHIGQEDNSTQEEKRIVAEDFLNTCQVITKNFELDRIFNMDETPVYIDMTSNKTLSFQGK